MNVPATPATASAKLPGSLSGLQQLLPALGVLMCSWLAAANQALAANPPTAVAPAIVCPEGASDLERLAAQEVRRYVYLRTGQLLPIRATPGELVPRTGGIVVARRDRPHVANLLAEPALRAGLASLEPQQFWLKTTKWQGRTAVVATGGDDVGTLYAAYRLAEHWGVRFYLHGDVLPDERAELRLPVLDERSMPLFPLRGIQPFHDFPEGPDWWNLDDYAAVLAQLPKLRMNFFALHTYPENAPNAEPTVWIGPAGDAGEGGRVHFSYPSSYQNTLRGNWGYAAKKTSDFAFGAAALFEHDAYGPDPMLGFCPQPDAPEDCNTVFERTADMLRGAFSLARRLGVRTCAGTETPLTLPKRVADRLRAAGKNPADAAVRQEVYEGIFARAVRAYPLDYYWFWTPEGWTWEGTKQEQIQNTLDDLNAALAAWRKVKPPFALATCGWVLGPQQDRALFDKVLPKEVAVSCINREVGKTPVDRGFIEVLGRGKWAIPWLEDDPGLTAPQLWVGRMRRDAADARRYGCDGLMGIHWRTRVLSPNVRALAQAAWNQAPWNAAPFEPPPPAPRVPGPLGGALASFPNNPIADTDADPVYQTVRYNLSAYRLPLPNGAYKVTLKFCEPHYSAAGKRVFGIKVQGQTVLERLDIFEKVGQNRALDFAFPNIAVTDGWLDVDFVPIIEFPSIAGLVVEGAGITRKINCGGPAYQDYTADTAVTPSPQALYPSTTDFYLDWARQEFGAAVGPEAAAILVKVDGALPRPADWVDGPGGIRPDARPWSEVQKEYAFVSEFVALRPQVRGLGNLARFDYWADTFRYLRAMGRVNCTWAAFNAVTQPIKAEKDPATQKQLARERALPLRLELVKQVEELYALLLGTVSTVGELGTVANWDQHNLPGLLTKPGEELARWLGEDLPAGAQPSKAYRGLTRIIVPTVRGSLTAGEPLKLKVIVLSEKPPRAAALRWRPLGRGRFAEVPLAHVARGVYAVELPATAIQDDLEYYVRVVPASGGVVAFPPTAPTLNQTVVVMAAPSR